MPNVNLARRFHSLPQAGVQIQHSGFCRDVGFLYVPSLGFNDLAQKTVFDVIANLNNVPGAKGLGAYPVSTTTYARINSTNFSLGYTLFALCSASGSAYEAILDDDAGGTRGFQFRFNNTGGINFIPFTNSDSFVSVSSSNYSAAELAAGVPVVARVDASGNIAVFGKGGKFTGSLGAAPRIPGNLGTNPGVWVFRNKTGALPLTRPLYMAGALNRVISDAEALAYLDDPLGAVFKPLHRKVYFDIGTSSGTAKTVIASLSAAIQSAQNSTASINAAIQQAISLNAGLDASIQTAKTLGAGADAAILMARSAQSGLDAVIQAAGTQTLTASVTAAIQQARTAQTALDAVISAPKSHNASLDGAIQEAFTVSAALDAAVMHARTSSAGLNGYILAGSVAVASLDAAIQRAATASIGIDAAIIATRDIGSSINAAIAGNRIATAALDAYINAGQFALASLDAAILIISSANTGMNAFISTGMQSAADVIFGVQSEARIFDVPVSRRIFGGGE